MFLAFVDVAPMPYTCDTPYHAPLGGSSSATAYLTAALAKLGQDVFLVNRVEEETFSQGVWCIPLESMTPELRSQLDVVVIVNLTGQGEAVRSMLPASTALILWTGHAHDQPAIAELHHPQERQMYDAIVCVSEWQKQCYMETFALPETQIQVIRNAISPAFERQQLPEKITPPILTYTSTPYRGLELLLDLFPDIRQAVPDLTLQVFSSMQVYGLPDSFASLYDRCRQMEGVEYFGSVSQQQLAKFLASATMLSYPNTFAETSCIAVMEAMASGCFVVTSDLGALSETLAGFGSLIPFNRDYRSHFVDQAIQYLSLDQAAAKVHLQAQIDYINQNCTWEQRAKEWITWLQA